MAVSQPPAGSARACAAFTLGHQPAGPSVRVQPDAPIPPHLSEVRQRASAVRRLLARVRGQPTLFVGLAPEGSDAAGRLMQQLARLGLAVTPVGVYEAGGGLAVRIGPAYVLPPVTARMPAVRDRETSRTVTRQIALQLPPELRGKFA